MLDTGSVTSAVISCWRTSLMIQERMDWLCLFAQALMRNFLNSFEEELEGRIDLPRIWLLRSANGIGRRTTSFREQGIVHIVLVVFPNLPQVQLALSLPFGLLRLSGFLALIKGVYHQANVGMLLKPDGC